MKVILGDKIEIFIDLRTALYMPIEKQNIEFNLLTIMFEFVP